MNQAMVPVPPSANRMYRIIRNRMYRSSDYMAWLKWWWLTDLGTGRDFRLHESEIFSKAPEYGGLFEEEKSNGQ